MEESKTGLTRQGAMAATVPTVGVLLQAAVCWLVFQGPLASRLLAYLLVAMAGAIGTGLFLACCLPAQANRLGCLWLNSDRRTHRWLVWFALLQLLALPTLIAYELLLFQTPAYGEVGFLLGLTLGCGAFWLGHWAGLHDLQSSAPCLDSLGEAESVVVATGPYRWVRHPRCLAGLLACLAQALLTGSLLALLPVIGLLILLIRRTVQTDRQLLTSWPAYGDYATRVRRRLLPGIW